MNNDEIIEKYKREGSERGFYIDINKTQIYGKQDRDKSRTYVFTDGNTDELMDDARKEKEAEINKLIDAMIEEWQALDEVENPESNSKAEPLIELKERLNKVSK